MGNRVNITREDCYKIDMFTFIASQLLIFLNHNLNRNLNQKEY